MNKRRIAGGAVLALLLLLLAVRPKPEDSIIGKTFLYEKDGFGGVFTISIYDDGTFHYYEGALSSYLGIGEWTLDGDTLLLADGGVRTNYFKVDGGDLVFLPEDSSNFIHVKVAGGERFSAATDADVHDRIQEFIANGIAGSLGLIG